jgi:hypothetical protein
VNNVDLKQYEEMHLKQEAKKNFGDQKQNEKFLEEKKKLLSLEIYQYKLPYLS